MGLVGFLLLSLLLRTASPLREVAHNSCSEDFLEDHHQLNKSGLHLPLHHVHGPCSPFPSSTEPFSDVLEQDEHRIKALHYRLTKTSKTSSNHLSGKLQPESVNIPLSPGKSVGIGNYIIKIGLGTPAKYSIMVVDTGSSLTWVQCQPCSIYCHPQVGPPFDPSTSSTSKYMPCSSRECFGLQAATLNPSACTRSNRCLYEASYGDSSYSVGYLVKDTLTVSPAQTLPGFVYGCGQDNEGLFGRSGGLIGLARNKLSMLAQLSTKYGFAFSYCLPTPAATGTLSFGQSSYNPTAFKFTRMYTDTRDPTLYFLRLTSIIVAQKALPISMAQYTSTPTIIDSGTVITRLPSTIYTALQGAFVKAMSRYTRLSAYSILDTCYKGSAQAMSVPEVRLLFEGGSELKLEPWNVLIDVDQGVTCLAFAASSGSGGVAIIGNRQQLKFRVVYDVTNLRIGFAAGGCG
eukprot:TRINITY_DN14273_c0_g1_i1.p1 TRINITY_DN14273_c0_g1~~TRINITY_DN14273_c0_g1_i1.p1  ORF type:complete len:460 (-),score=-10.75 TRINITY_DN14273_c0_g1_i1:234-1613(-)